MKSATLKPGKYVVAVSGGVDSMSLLHMLSTQYDRSTHTFVVAHFNHGIRADSDADYTHVQHYAKQLRFPFAFDRGQLGKQASEAEARKARYRFLRVVKQSAGADAIVTAHHKDDAMETAVFNLLRGTGRQGVLPFRSSSDIQRPLLWHSKADLYAYARKHGIDWREDSTNQDTTYRRNYIRHKLLPRATGNQRAALERHLMKLDELSRKIDELIQPLIAQQPAPNQLDRRVYAALPHVVARELLVVWLRRNGLREFDRPTVERLTVAVKTASSGARHDVRSGYFVVLDDDTATIQPSSEKKS